MRHSVYASIAVFLASVASISTAQTPASGSPQAAAAPATNAAPGDKLICKKRLKTGTLADFQKICHTKAEWERIGAAWRDTWGEIQGSKGSTRGN